MTEVQRATHPGGGSVTLSKVLTRRKDHGGNDHHRDGASPVKRTKSGVQIHPGSPPPLTVSPGRDDDDRGSLTSTEAPWVARWLAGRGTPRHGATDDHHGPDTHGDGIHPPRRAGSTSPTISRTTSTTLPTEPLGSEFTTNWFTHNADSLGRVFTQLGWMNDSQKPRKVLEIGCWEGRGTQWLLCALCRHRDSAVHCVDTWRGGDQYADLGLELRGERHSGAAVEARFDANVRLVTGVDPNCGSERDADRENELGETPGTERVRVGEPDAEGDVPNPVRKWKARSVDVLASLLGVSAGTFDVAYVDGSHAARDVIGDGVMCWELLRRGGVMVFDDYRWDRVMGDAVPPKRCPRMAVDAFLGMFEDELVVLDRGYQVVVQKIATRR
jgi:predicted O-methyltransferase YrrM